MQPNKKSKISGFTMIELLVTVSILSIISVTFLNAYTTNITTARHSRIKSVATTIVMQKMESLKNLSYDQLSTMNGSILPQGTIPDNEIVVNDGLNYNVNYLINYYDDPFDGCAIFVTSSSSQCSDNTIISKSQDLFPYDYKKITIIVKNHDNTKKLAESSTNIASHAAETSTNTGILAISVVDASGAVVPDANITITNTAINPNINISTRSSADALTLIPLLPPATNTYHIVVDKVGYSTASSYPITPTNPNPSLSDASIIIQSVTNITLSIDRLSNLEIYTFDESGNALANQQLKIDSSKTIDQAGLIPKFTQNITTDGLGYFKIDNLEWGSYQFNSTGSYILTANPYQPIQINPNQNAIINLVISSNSSLVRISTLSPYATTTGGIASFTLTGNNLTGINNIEFIGPDNSNITASNLIIIDESTMTFDLDLTTAIIGDWKMRITKGTEILIQNNALKIN